MISLDFLTFVTTAYNITDGNTSDYEADNSDTAYGHDQFNCGAHIYYGRSFDEESRNI